MSTTKATTIFFPKSTGGPVVWISTAGGTAPSAITATGAETTFVGSGFALFVPFSTSANANVNVSVLVQVLGSGTPGLPAIYGVYSPAYTAFPLANDSNQVVSTSETLLIPVTDHLGSKVHITSSIDALRSANAAATSPQSTAATATGTTTTNSSAPTHSASPTNNSSTTSSSSTSGPSRSKDTGALAGGIVGALLGGLIIGALVAFFCLRRRQSSRRKSLRDSSDSYNGKPIAMDTMHKQQPQVGVAAADVTGWQKHLPQDKDDRTIANAFHSVFEQIQTYMDGFYESETHAPSNASIQRLEKLSSDGLAKVLSHTDEAILVLEAILTRFIVHRISGRSSVGESFLPLEFTTILEKNQWHMERDGNEDGSVAENKRGFQQAFSQWRRLTGFLGADPGTDQGYKTDLDRKINNAVQVLEEAFAYWEKPGSNKADRTGSLREIVVQASDAGVVLFTQPSTFMFDWSSHDDGRSRTIVVSPTLVKRLDEAAEPLRQEQVLLEARKARI